MHSEGLSSLELALIAVAVAVALSLGIYLWQGRRGPGGRSLRTLAPLGIGVALVVVAFVLLGLRVHALGLFFLLIQLGIVGYVLWALTKTWQGIERMQGTLESIREELQGRPRADGGRSE